MRVNLCEHPKPGRRKICCPYLTKDKCTLFGKKPNTINGLHICEPNCKIPNVIDYEVKDEG